MKNFVAPLFILLFFSVNAQITLTHNTDNVPIDTGMYNCDHEEYWARVFTLSDFGISVNDQFTLKSGQVAISNSYDGARIIFNIYSVDSNFPNSSPEVISWGNLVLAPQIGNTPEIVQIDFGTAITIPAGVERILVEVYQDDDIYNPNYKEVTIAGTANDNDVSWFKGCRKYYTYTPTTDLTNPVADAKFFINITGEKKSISSLGATTRLTHNVCDDIIETRIHSCTTAYIYWARAFTLDDFGISTNEEFVINSGQVGINKTGWLAEIRFNIYRIDNDFPNSFSENDLIGSSQYQELRPSIGRDSQIIEVIFDNPVVVPAGVERILVEVHKGIVYGDGVAFIAGTTQDNDVSWQRGCTHVVGGTNYGNTYVSTADFGHPDANFYINVTGNVNHVTNNFEMNISNICSEFLKEFSVSNSNDIAQITWDFGDSASGADNISTDLSPFHDFSSDGTYTITATVTANDGSVEVLTETIEVKEPPNTYGINNLEACEDNEGTGFSSTFDTSNIESQILGSQTDKVVTYIDGSGNEYSSLPNPFSNKVRNRETITVRVSRSEELCCYSETTFDLIVNPLPEVTSFQDITECDDDNDGFTMFDLSQIEADVIAADPNILVEFYHEDGTQIINLNVENKIVDKETITASVINQITNCTNETAFDLIVAPLPIANPIPEIIGCDDNGDGISEYFDVSDVENIVLLAQTGLEVSYYDNGGNLLPNPLPNPYTNTVSNQEIITVRVTNPTTTCFSETELVLKTSEKPQISAPDDVFSCDEGNGFSIFDLSNIETEIIGAQNNLNVYFYDSSGSEITNDISSSFTNSEAWMQTISVRVENAFSPACFSETNFSLVVNNLPEVSIEESYFICNLEPSLSLSVDPNLDFWEWTNQDGTVISDNFSATLVDAGNYSLKIGKTSNGIYCENTYNFELIRSILPKIENVEYRELSDDNYIRIIASGDGDFEYSIDGVNFQDDNQFNNLLGGVYTVYVRDKLGCGEDSQEVTLIDYPKFFTPNGDGYNDFWQIKGIQKYPESQVHIFDRYGKLLKQITPSSVGWDGTFNGELMPSTDYWFTLQLDGFQRINGHFTLKR